MQPGTIIDQRYEILSYLGSGGMCVVYKARQLDIQRDVALKMLHRRLVVDKKALERFRREAQAISALQHPNIVKAYGFGLLPDKVPGVSPFARTVS